MKRDAAQEAPLAATLRTTIYAASRAHTLDTKSTRPQAADFDISLAPPAKMPEGGLKLAVTGLLGHGGMGSVLLAKQPLIGREVAVKVAHGPDSAEQLLAEARMTGAVEHPGVIPVYGIGSDQRGLPALVMRRVAGMSWRQLLDDAEHPFWAKLEAPGDVRLETNLNLLVQICNTLAAAHARGVIHRDLKPDNILLGEFGELYVADWGIARQMTDSVESSVVGTISGSPRAAPRKH